MNFWKIKREKKRYFTSLFIVLFYIIYFLIGSIANEFNQLKYIYISTYLYMILNIVLLCFINYELLKLFSLIQKKYWLFQSLSYISIIFLYLAPYTTEIGNYPPYKEINLIWLHSWMIVLFYLFFGLLYLLIASINKYLSKSRVLLQYFFVLFIVLAFKSITIIMLDTTDYGWTSLLFIFLIVILSDSFAYLGGSLYGKHYFAPKISPKKTWEGFITGIIFGTLLPFVFAILIYDLAPNITFSNTYTPFISIMPFKISSLGVHFVLLLFAFIFSVVSQFGDLFFSWVKRRYDIKDFSNLLPGHGGFLDRLDSLIVTTTFAFLLTNLMLRISGI